MLVEEILLAGRKRLHLHGKLPSEKGVAMFLVNGAWRNSDSRHPARAERRSASPSHKRPPARAPASDSRPPHPPRLPRRQYGPSRRPSSIFPSGAETSSSSKVS